MYFDMTAANAKVEYNRNKPAIGRHLCEILDVRQTGSNPSVKDGHKGHGFFMDFRVVEGPSGRGFEFTFMVFPELAIPHGRTTKAMAIAGELGKIRVAIAAACGLHAAENGKIGNEECAAALDHSTGHSFLRGRKVVVDCVPHTNKSGGKTSFLKIYPAIEGDDLRIDPAGETPARYRDASPAQPEVRRAPPALPSAKKFPPEGWVTHPDNSSYFYDENDPDKGVLSEEQLRAL